jgi:glycosyltransferase involved in cell wall biosynthesis
LIVNDASTDNTLKILEEYRANVDFPIRIISNSENKMLYYNFNLAFDEAQGELMVFAGHDDKFDADTLETFDAIWTKYGRSDISGIWCTCRDQNANLVGTPLPDTITVSNYFDMFLKYIYRQERFGCTRTDILRNCKFDIDSHRIGESFLWEKIGKAYQTIYLNKTLRTYYIEPEVAGALTKRSRKQIALPTFLSYLDWNNEYIYKFRKYPLFQLRIRFALLYYGKIASISFYEILSQIKRKETYLIYLLIYPISFFMSRKYLKS